MFSALNDASCFIFPVVEPFAGERKWYLMIMGCGAQAVRARISRMGTGSAHQRFPAPCFVNATERGVYQCNAMFINASEQARLLRRKMRRLRCVHERKSKVPWQPLPVPRSQWPNRLHLLGPQLCSTAFLVHGVNTDISRKTTILEGMWSGWCKGGVPIIKMEI